MAERSPRFAGVRCPAAASALALATQRCIANVSYRQDSRRMPTPTE